MVTLPTLLEGRLHEPLPLRSVMEQVLAPSPTVTEPVGVPLPGAAAATLTLTV